MKAFGLVALLATSCAHDAAMPAVKGVPTDGRIPLSAVIEANDSVVWEPSIAYPTLQPSSHRHASHDHIAASGPMEATGWLAFKAYQGTFSRLDGSTCRFRPTCSGFGLDAVSDAGLWGVALTFARLQRDHSAAKHFGSSTPPFLDDPLENYRFTVRRPQLDDFDAYSDPAHAWYQHVRAVSGRR